MTLKRSNESHDNIWSFICHNIYMKRFYFSNKNALLTFVFFYSRGRRSSHQWTIANVKIYCVHIPIKCVCIAIFVLTDVKPIKQWYKTEVETCIDVIPCVCCWVADCCNYLMYQVLIVSYQVLTEQCWSIKPTDRPTFADINKELQLKVKRIERLNHHC